MAWRGMHRTTAPSSGTRVIPLPARDDGATRMRTTTGGVTQASRRAPDPAPAVLVRRPRPAARGRSRPHPTVIPAKTGTPSIGRSALHVDIRTIVPMKSGIHRDDGSQYARHGEDARRSVALVLCRPTPHKSQFPQRSHLVANIRPLDPPQPSTSSTFARARHHAPLDHRPRPPSATLHFLNIRRPHPLVTLHFLNVRA